MALGMMAGGAALGLAGSLMKKKPKIPTYKKVDQTKEQEAGIAANLASFDQAKQLADQTTAADQDRLESILSRTMPNYKQMLSGAGSAVQNMISGKLATEDQAMYMRQSAERGGTLGISGSGAGRNLTARDLGLSSLQMTQAGLGAFNQLSSNVRQNYTVNPMSTSAMYVSPSQRISNAIQENQYAHQAAIGKAQSDAANSWQTKLGGFAQQVGGMAMGAGMQKYLAGSNNIGSTMGNTGQHSTYTPSNPTLSYSGYNQTTPYSGGLGGSRPIGGNYDPMMNVTRRPY
jgi:hypothetical protein